MAENSTKVEIRKLRKKLRQIEHLERLERDLTHEEYEKVLKKSATRGLLKEKLEKLDEENEIRNLSEMMDKTVNNEETTADIIKTEEQVPAERATVWDSKLTEKNFIASNAEAVPEYDIQSNGDSSLERQVASQIVESLDGSLSASSSSEVSQISNVSLPNMKQSKKQATTSQCSSQWLDRKFIVQCLEGHNDHVFSVDMDCSVLISGSRDTMLKVWDCDIGKEVRSLGGHTGGITSVVLVRKENQESNSLDRAYIGVSGSQDCSIKMWSLGDGETLRSIYAYSPVLCLDRMKENLVSGSESGKVELWDFETGQNICSARSDDESVTCVKFKHDQIASGSSTGVVKLWDVRQRSLTPALASNTLSVPFVKKRRVHCLATTDNAIYWGDDGTNIKVLDIRAGKVRKLINHLTEFGSTSAMAIQDSFLISSGYDLDKGKGYLNVRTLPDEKYLATLDDDITSYISCLCCTDVKKDGVVCQRLCTGGGELKFWDQMTKNKDRKRSRSDEDSSFITSKHLRRYSTADQIDTESSDDSDEERRDDSSDDEDENEGTSTNARQSWCTIS